MSKCTPITAKAKQSPFKANEALIEGAARAYGSVKGKDKQVTETKTIKGDKVEKFAKTPEEIRKWKEAMKKNPNAADRYKDKTVTTTSTVEGDNIDYDTTLKTAVKGDVFTPYERRQESRDTKKSYRDEKRARLKAERAKNKLNKAESKGNSKRTARLKIKSEIADKKAKDFKAASKRGSLSKQSGLAPGASGAYLYDRDVSLGERTDKQQLEQARNEALRKNNSGFSFSSTSSTPNYGIDAAEKFMENTKRKGFPMRSGFKMKGYGKKK